MHRDDPDTMGEATGLGGVFPSGDEEVPDSRAANADGLLLDAADRRHGTVELDLPRGGDPPTVVDVPAELLEHVEREREPGRRSADVARVDLDVERQLDRRGLVDEDADDRSIAIVRTATRVICLPRRTPSARVCPGLCAPMMRRRSLGERTRWCAALTMTSVGRSFPAAGASLATCSTSAPEGLARTR